MIDYPDVKKNAILKFLGSTPTAPGTTIKEPVPTNVEGFVDIGDYVKVVEVGKDYVVVANRAGHHNTFARSHGQRCFDPTDFLSLPSLVSEENTQEESKTNDEENTQEESKTNNEEGKEKTAE